MTGAGPARTSRRRRRVRAGAVAVVGAAVAAGAGYGLSSLVGSSPPAPVVSPRAGGVLLGDGIGAARFGQSEAAAVSALDRVLGTPKSDVPIDERGNCTVDAAVQWPGVTAYFDGGHFVGYSTLSADGRPAGPADLTTARGLRVGDTLSEAQRIYGAALRTSLAQGGTWFVSTSSGTIEGYLSAEVNQNAATPRIAAIVAGAVGCPAASP